MSPSEVSGTVEVLEGLVVVLDFGAVFGVDGFFEVSQQGSVEVFEGLLVVLGFLVVF